jgi:titin
VVDGLENGVAYRFRVSAINSVGSSSASDPSEEIRPTSNAPSKPINLTIISRTSSTIVLDWAAPSYIGPVGSTLQDYIVDYAEATDPPGSLSWQSINTEGVSDITISNISEELTYYIRVRAINNLAQGAYASIKSIGSNDEPQPPEPEEDPSETWDFGIVQFTGVCI